MIKDLIVDMGTFFTCYQAVEPVFRPGDPDPEKERLMTPEAVRELEQYTTCILCAACFAACPVNGKNPRYIGPAALAKLYRFHIDPREQPGAARLMSADQPDGWWACEFHTNCRRVCPKGVPPDKAIGHARQELKKIKQRKGIRRRWSMMRHERDPLGVRDVPSDVYYGIQTLRAVENFPVSGRREPPELIAAYAVIKKAAALTNMELGSLDLQRGMAIVTAAEEDPCREICRSVPG